MLFGAKRVEIMTEIRIMKLSLILRFVTSVGSV